MKKPNILLSTFYFLLSRRFGQSALEILVAIGILAISLSAAIIVISGSQSISVDSQEANKASNIAREYLENAVASAKNSFSGLVSASSTQDEFLKEIIVNDVDANTKQATIRVSWNTDTLRTQKIELKTLVTNWQIYQDTGGDTGGGGLSGNWQNPQTLGSVDLGPGESATGLDVINKIIYLSATASDKTKADFFIVNATNGQSPYVVSKIDTGSGLNAIDAAGNYAYAANQDNNAQLQIMDITNAASPYVIKSFKLSGVSGNGAIGQSVFYSNGKAYVGTKTASGPEFHIVDVSNPAIPSDLGSFEVGADVNDILVSGNTAYLATSADNGELMIFDVSDSSNITKTGSFDAAAGDDGKSVFVSGTTAYLGRTGGSSDFVIINVSNPASPQQLGVANLGGAGVNGIYTKDYLAFIVTTDSNKEFQIWNISTSSAPTLWSSYNFPQVGTGVDYENNFIYISVRSNDAVRIITSAN
ncbi:MAG: hypothetical protein AAB536_01310 [Patescibacteria group bacterium]